MKYGWHKDIFPRVWLAGCLLVALLATACGGGGAHRVPQPEDTLYTEKAAMLIYGNQPDSALRIIDSAVAVGNLAEDRASLLRATVFSKSLVEHRYDTAMMICEALMDSPFVDNIADRVAVLDLLVYTARQLNSDEQYLRWATEKAELCRQRGEEVEMLRTEAEIGYILIRLDEVERGLAKLDGIIATLDRQERFNALDACVIALKRKINAFELLERPAEMVPLAQRIIDKMEVYRLHSDRYADGSYRMPPTDDKVRGYCDFYAAQAHGFMAKAYAMLGNGDSARRHMAFYEASPFFQTLSGRLTAAPTWGLLGEYDRMLATYDEAVAQMGADTIDEKYAIMLQGRATAADARGQHRVASGYWKRYAQLNNTLNHRLQTSRAHEYAARYSVQEERLRAEREQAKAHNRLLMVIVLLLFALLSVLFIIWLLVQRQVIYRKNRALVEQISEALKYKQMHEAEAATAVPLDLDGLDDTHLFEYMAEVIRREQLYLNPDCGRQTLVDRFHITDRRIGAAFAQGSPHKSLPDFIRELRLEHACHLLASRPEMSIGEVATASGFSSLTVFGRDFKRKLDVTPTFYRRAATEAQDG